MWQALLLVLVVVGWGEERGPEVLLSRALGSVVYLAAQAAATVSSSVPVNAPLTMRATSSYATTAATAFKC